MVPTDTGRDRRVCTAFEGPQQIAQGAFAEVVAAAKAAFDRSATSTVLVFDDTTGEVIDLDYSGSPAEVLRGALARDGRRPASEVETAQPARGPGRPRLGVVAREVTLLPRHWQWLNLQPGGASVALRRLVEEARRAKAGQRHRRAQEVAYRFMSALAGDLPGFEEAIRALFAGAGDRFDEHTSDWPGDVRRYARMLAAPAFEKGPAANPAAVTGG